jgi:hypothetical protein
MYGPTCKIFWANLTPFSLCVGKGLFVLDLDQATGAPHLLGCARRRDGGHIGINPMVTLEKQRVNMIGNLV